MKNLLIIAFAMTALTTRAQQDKHMILDLGVNKHSKYVAGLTYSLGLKQIVNSFGIWATFVGIDKNRDITSNSMGASSNYALSSYKGSPFGFGAGANYCFEKCGLTVSAGVTSLTTKTIVTYYNAAVTAKQNELTPYKYYRAEKKISGRIFVDYDFLKKNEKLELGIRAGYDTYSSIEAGIFIGYKFVKHTW